MTTTRKEVAERRGKHMAKKSLGRIYAEWEANQIGWRDYMLDWGYYPQRVRPDLRDAYRAGYLQAEEADRRAREHLA